MKLLSYLRLAAHPGISEHDRETLCRAIQSRRVVGLSYLDGYVTVEPYALGRLADGETGLLCYQTSGTDRFMPLSGWRLYRGRDMKIQFIGEQVFTIRPPEESREFQERYRAFSELICVVWDDSQDIIEDTVIPPSGTRTSPPGGVVVEPEETHNQKMFRFRRRHSDTAVKPVPKKKPAGKNRGRRIDKRRNR